MRCALRTCKYALLAFTCLWGILGVVLSVYLYFNEVANALTVHRILAMISFSMIMLSTLGCYISGKSRRCMPTTVFYVSQFALSLFISCFGGREVGAVLDSVSYSIQVAKDNKFQIHPNQPDAFWAVNVLYNHLHKVYDERVCEGGGANLTKWPVLFDPIECQSDSYLPMHEIFPNEASVISTRGQWDYYLECLYTYTGEDVAATRSNFTQAFCGSRQNVMDFAQKYSRWAMLFIICSAVVLCLLVMFTVPSRRQPDEIGVSDRGGDIPLVAGRENTRANAV